VTVIPPWLEGDDRLVFSFVCDACGRKSGGRTLFAEGAGLITTRTVSDWLFTAEDPLVRTLGEDPNVAFVKNITANKTQADAAPKQILRIYTGNNDLYWSLMPYNAGDILTFWAQNISIQGFNGSQFLTDNYVKKVPNAELTLWNPLVNRSIPIQYWGEHTWSGIATAYLSLTSDALASEYQNPDNAIYYSQYSGLINKTSNPPMAPLFLSQPDFVNTDPTVHQNLTFTDDIFTPYDTSDRFSEHRFAIFVMVEPTLGSSVWGNVPMQINLKYGPTTMFYPNVKPSFAPIYWNAITDQATKHDTDQIKSQLYTGRKAWKALVGLGAGLGGVLMILGAVGLVVFRDGYRKATPNS